MSDKTLIQFNGHKDLGDEYHGNDEGHTLDMKIGRVTLVSIEKAKQLICDFGHAFSYAKLDEESTPSSAKAVEQKSDAKKEVRRTVLRRHPVKRTPKRSKKKE